MKYGGVAAQVGDLQPTDVVVVGQIQAAAGESVDFGNGISFTGVPNRHFGFAAFYSDGVAQWVTLGGGSSLAFGDRGTAVAYGDDVYVSFQTQAAAGSFSLSSAGCSPVALNGQTSLVVARLSASTGACIWMHGTTATTTPDRILG